MFDPHAGMFGGQYHLIALTAGPEPVANHTFTVALCLRRDRIDRIHLRSVKYIDPRFHCHIHLRKSIRLICLCPVGHRPKTEVGNHNPAAAQFVHFHAIVLLFRVS